jgi:predicted Zn-ribbon and HTH transcriptional regulator
MTEGRRRFDEEPAASTRTHRAAIAAALRGPPLSAREISALVSLSERDVIAHLEHLERSLAHAAEQLRVLPARCVQCQFSFDQRTRRSRPSRCPKCKSERIEPARFAIRAGRG